jgi:hypothetical protein
MFSFGGFSSILPYIGYLSVMWICIIIGVGGQLKNYFGVKDQKLQKTETVISKEHCTSEYACFQRVISEKSVKSQNLFATDLYFQFRNIIKEHPVFSEGSTPLVLPQIAIACGLRAPPSII